ncbi:superoxide dismutase [Phenylobacterium sp.]|jgi:Fe-Mn family superoxide dismutase|uniref:superoxide dismutase n=1 Tax=Phenylobacterium sp. TaxID=1871053 RepID=UPI002E31E0E8|nr:superoxide dismutase [Phenylobacterium sp.]HEX3364893.1 superoxide dismutase [Phenylobacterium sp.]
MFTLPKLPYDYAALEPTLSADTLHTHHDKHHKAYVEKTNELATKAGLDGGPLEEVVRESAKASDKRLFHNAAQAWNHAFFWDCMTPKSAAPTGELKAAIDEAFGSLDAFKDAFVEEGFNHFGSGWVWLVTGSEGLKVISTHDADDTLVKDGLFPLLVCDLWEHAYYLDYKNDRKGFLKAWLDRVANYAFAGKQLAASEGQGDGFRYPSPSANDDSSDRRAAPGEAERPQA